MQSPSKKTKSLRVRAKRTIRRRWVQACVVVVVWLLVMGGTVRWFGPKPTTDTAKLKYIHCDNDACRLEMPYDAKLVGQRCARCSGTGKEGFFVATEKSIKAGTQVDPWTRLYVILFVETFLMLAVMTYLMYRTVPDPSTQFYVITCPYCNQRLRYRALSHGGQGACSKCRRFLRFPDEEDAVSEEEVLLADAEAARAEAEAARAEAEAEAEAEEARAEAERQADGH